MLNDLLNTKVKLKIAMLFSKEKGPFQVSDTARKLSISKSRASECLKELEKGGLLKSRAIGRSLIYERASTKSAEAILQVLRHDERLLSKIDNVVKDRLKALNPISIIRFGSSIKGLKPGSDVDIFIIFKEKANADSVHRISAELSEEFGIHVSIMYMTIKELREKAKRGEEFVLRVIATHKLVYGKNLEDLIWQEK